MGTTVQRQHRIVSSIAPPPTASMPIEVAVGNAARAGGHPDRAGLFDADCHGRLDEAADELDNPR